MWLVAALDVMAAETQAGESWYKYVAVVEFQKGVYVCGCVRGCTTRYNLTQASWLKLCVSTTSHYAARIELIQNCVGQPTVWWRRDLWLLSLFQLNVFKLCFANVWTFTWLEHVGVDSPSVN
eukprot:894143-Pelagomonas_calceolata.AAC.3